MHCNYRIIQKVILMICYFTYLTWSYFKIQFADEKDFINFANKVDIVIAVCMGALLKIAYGLGATLREISDALPPEMSQKFESLFVLNKKAVDNTEKIAKNVESMSFRIPGLHGDPFNLSVPEIVTETIDTGRETIHNAVLDDGRSVRIAIQRDVM